MFNKDELKRKHKKLYALYRYFSDIKKQYKEYKLQKYWKSIPKDQYQGILTAMYEKKFNYKLDWNNLQTYTEKMQWEKLYHYDIRKIEYSDKYKVRKWVEKTIGTQYLVPLLGVWSNARQIDFSSLPKQFVLKTNNGSGDVIIVENKDSLSKDEIRRIKRQLNISLKKDYSYDAGFEMHYSQIEPKIIAERFLEHNIQDYKFLCFGGKPYFCWVDIDRFTDHRRNIYDLDWNKCRWEECYKMTDKVIPKPENFTKMIELVTALCQDFAHVRVDMYNVKGKIYFGEMTFTSGSGFEHITPEEMNMELGNMWVIDTSHKTYEDCTINENSNCKNLS